MTDSRSTFRVDIAGLRALAVLSITIFHINKFLVPGGYVGVDIFFVISGFLIIGSISRELASGEFSFVRFYAKRVRRLFPALFIALLFTYIIGFIFLTPSELLALGKSAIASLLYLSNIYFFETVDYFSNTEIVPLLHTWSLGVEEQFYIFAPLFLSFVFMFGRKVALSLLVGIFVASLAWSEVLVRTSQAQEAFYLVHTRAWEFLVGGFVALSSLRLRQSLAEALAFLGLCIILASFALQDEALPFPGLYSAIPVTGAAMIILAGNSARTWTGRVISVPIFTFFGRISYSLYLFHWPVVVFYRLLVRPDIKILDEIVIFSVSVLCATLSERFVERRFLAGPIRSERGTIGAGFACTALLVASISPSVIWDGLPSRLDDRSRRIADYMHPNLADWRPNSCFISSGTAGGAAAFDAKKCLSLSSNLPKVLILGDSNAAHYYPALVKAFPQISFSQVTVSGCVPTIEAKGAPRCTELVGRAFREFVPNAGFDAIILSARWQIRDLKALNRTIGYLSKYTDKVIVFGRSMSYPVPLPRLLMTRRFYRLAPFPGEDPETMKFVWSIEDAFRSKLSKRALFVSTLDWLCDRQKCTHFIDDDVPVLFDEDHLTEPAAERFVARFASLGILPVGAAKQSLAGDHEGDKIFDRSRHSHRQETQVVR